MLNAQSEAPTHVHAQCVARIEFGNGMRVSVNARCLPLRIGRADDCDICIVNDHVSRYHCELYMRDNELCLRDTSTNGSSVDGHYINGSSVTLHEITHVRLAGAHAITIIPTGSDSDDEHVSGTQKIILQH